MTTKTDVEKDLQSHFDLQKMKEEAYNYRPGMSDLMWRLYQSGEWITWKMEQQGASEQETKDQSFVVGQRTWPNKDPFEAAAQTYDAWVDGRAETPGRALGETIAAAYLE